MFTIATELNSINCVFESSIELDKLTFSPLVDQKELEDQIELNLRDLELRLELDPKELTIIESLLNNYFQFDKKEEFRFRYGSLVKLSGLSNELLKITKDENVSEEKINKLYAEVSNCGHGPFRSLLENNLAKLIIKDNTNVEEHNYSELLITTNDLNELDEAICELSIEQYIDLGKENRLFVAEQLLLIDRTHMVIDDVINEIIKLSLVKPAKKGLNGINVRETIKMNELNLL
ncbi:hypothetical protein [Fictibacillus phosphorivorans]|uniref:hypothetical protein n=1 Tax=Fictibacillus phosphorivorans TaxID=1221500 RepID=UPI0012938F3A|nr:hypothetical protein [Fictibacillus phosphorivorans]MQR94764.1 hypothetical protein [Fictibacillus phosphorivorans]